MKTQIGISEKNTGSITDILNTWLSDEYVLTTKTKNFHWNVSGPDFFGLHQFFEVQYRELDMMLDEVAERIRMLGHYAVGTMSDFLKMTHLSESKNGDLNPKSMLQELLRDHEIIIRWLRTQSEHVDEKFKDGGTSDFMISMLERHEKMAWMIRSHLG
jgi:starvation-inducible DNA-binding protein